MDPPAPYVEQEDKLALNTKALPVDGYARQLDLQLELRCGQAERVCALAGRVRRILNSRAQNGLSRCTIVFIPSCQDITGTSVSRL